MTGWLLAYASGQAPAAQTSGIITGDAARTKPKGRTPRGWQLPTRDLFEPITSYPEHGTKFGLLGNIEATRGCHHRLATAPSTPPTASPLSPSTRPW